jgi:CHAD domain
MKRSKIEDPTGSLVQEVGNAIKFASMSNGISDRGAHETRKSVKKARAALRLLRPVLGDAIYHRENTVFKNASRSISPLRDARAQLDVIDSLRKRYGQRNATTDLKSLKVRMRARIVRMRRKISGSARQVRRAVA